MRSKTSWIIATSALLTIAGCGMANGRSDKRPAMAPGPVTSELQVGQSGPTPIRTVGDEPPMLGPSYSIDGHVYAPSNPEHLDQIGYAAVLPAMGDERRTTDGDVYNPKAISAAHQTLPMPSYVEVTAIRTGKTILVRINDRGPMLNDRIIALSPGAATQLGIVTDGTAPVRVRRVYPLAQEQAVLRSGGQVPQRLDSPPGLLTALRARLGPTPAPLTHAVRTVRAATDAGQSTPARTKIAPVATVAHKAADERAARLEPASKPYDVATQAGASYARPPAKAPSPKVRPTPTPKPAAKAGPVAAQQGRFVVQIAAISSKVRAEMIANKLGGYVMRRGTLYRIRTGPYPTRAAAAAGLNQVRAKGYAGALIMANDSR